MKLSSCLLFYSFPALLSSVLWVGLVRACLGSKKGAEHGFGVGFFVGGWFSRVILFSFFWPRAEVGSGGTCLTGSFPNSALVVV